jgi:hypothetical protein
MTPLTILLKLTAAAALILGICFLVSGLYNGYGNYTIYGVILMCSSPFILVVSFLSEMEDIFAEFK